MTLNQNLPAGIRRDLAEKAIGYSDVRRQINAGDFDWMNMP